MYGLIKTNRYTSVQENITRSKCLTELKDVFINPYRMIDSLYNGEIEVINTENYSYKLSKRQYYNIIVSIKFQSNLDKGEFQKFLENYSDMWDYDGNIIIDEKTLEKNEEDGRYKFEFVGVESEDGEEIKIWR